MNKLLKIVKEHEGFSPWAYQDSLGYWTVGYGKCLDKRQNCGLTEEEATYLLTNELSSAELELSHFDWFKLLDTVRQDVLIELCFNIGLSGVLKFHQMINAIQNKDYPAAAMHLLNSLWAKQVSKDRSENMANRLSKGTYD